MYDCLCLVFVLCCVLFLSSCTLDRLCTRANTTSQKRSPRYHLIRRAAGRTNVLYVNPTRMTKFVKLWIRRTYTPMCADSPFMWMGKHRNTVCVRAQTQSQRFTDARIQPPRQRPNWRGWNIVDVCFVFSVSLLFSSSCSGLYAWCLCLYTYIYRESIQKKHHNKNVFGPVSKCLCKCKYWWNVVSDIGVVGLVFISMCISALIVLVVRTILSTLCE